MCVGSDSFVCLQKVTNAISAIISCSRTRVFQTLFHNIVPWVTPFVFHQRVGSHFQRLVLELGDAAKRRFQEFAANWGDPNRPQAQNHSDSASGGGNPRRHNERRGLLSNDLDMDEEEEEEELNFVGGGRGGSGEFVELGDVRGAGSKKKD